MQGNLHAETSVVPSLEALCVNIVRESLAPDNVCSMLAAVSALQPALSKLLEDLVCFLCAHLKMVLSLKVRFQSGSPEAFAQGTCYDRRMLSLIILHIASAPLHVHSRHRSIKMTSTKCGDVSTLTSHLHTQEGFVCLPLPILKELLSRQSMVRWSWLG